MLGLLASGCASWRDSTPCTDYQVGQTYRVSKPVFLFVFNKSNRGETPTLAPLGYAATPKSFEEFVRARPNDPRVAGLLVENDRLRVTSAKLVHAFAIGTFTHVEATILSGDGAGKRVDLTLISRGRLPGACLYVDPEYLDPITVP